MPERDDLIPELGIGSQHPVQEPFEPCTVTARDMDRGIDAEPAGGLPREHVIGDVPFEQAVAVEVTEHAVAHGVLEFAPVGGRQCLGGPAWPVGWLSKHIDVVTTASAAPSVRAPTRKASAVRGPDLRRDKN